MYPRYLKAHQDGILQKKADQLYETFGKLRHLPQKLPD